MTKEFIAKAKACKTKEELAQLAKDENVKLSEEDIRRYFENSTKTGELSDDELDNVAGGTCYGDGWDGVDRPVVTDSNVCGLYSAYYGHIEWPAICPNCTYYSGRVNGVTISAFSGYCTHKDRVKGKDVINQ